MYFRAWLVFTGHAVRGIWILWSCYFRMVQFPTAWNLLKTGMGEFNQFLLVAINVRLGLLMETFARICQRFFWNMEYFLCATEEHMYWKSYILLVFLNLSQISSPCAILGCASQSWSCPSVVSLSFMGSWYIYLLIFSAAL